MRRAALVLCLALGPVLASAAGEAVTRSVLLHPGDGEPIRIGSIRLIPDGDGQRFELNLDSPRFEPRFLSMRPFRCLQGEQTLCHLPYPYDWRRRITDADLTDLEYGLLFIRKSPEEYGIDPWNGLYYRLRRDGEGFTGVLHEVDLDVLAVPPDPGDRRPITPEMLTPAVPAAHWLPRLTIE